MDYSGLKQNKQSKAVSLYIFDKLLEEIGSELSRNIDPVLGYSEKILVDRFLQKFKELEENSFKRKYAGLDSNSVLKMESIRFHRFVYSTSSKKLSINKLYLAISLVRFFKYCLYVLFINIIALLNFPHKNNKEATLVYGISNNNLFINGNDSEFINFCINGDIEPLKKAKSIIVECIDNVKPLNSESIEYRKNPLHALLFRNRNKFNEFIKFLKNHMQAIIAYIKLLFFSRVFSVLYKDFSYHALVRLLDDKHAIENVMITLSNHSEQLLCMSSLKGKNFHLHMAWYAICETYYHKFKWDKCRILSKGFKYIRVDESWVWTKDFSLYLRKIGVTGIFHYIGPILWLLPEKIPVQIPELSRKSINVCIFDRNPNNKSTIEDFGELHFYRYFSYSNMSKFINDIICVIDNIEEHNNIKINLLLKSRMSNAGYDDERYNALIKKIAEVEKRISIVDPYVNLYSLVGNCDAIIVFPYSSPAYVADYMNIPAIYFDPTQNLVPIYECADEISFASGKNELEDKLYNALL